MSLALRRRPAGDKLASLRTRMRGQLRSGFDYTIVDMSGVTGASMAYTEDGFANDVVVRCGLKMVGWPSDVPFVNLSDIRGGIVPLLKLRTLWRNGTLRFERATPEEIASAARDPRSVHPNPPPADGVAAVALRAQTLSRRPAVVVSPLVLHPSTLAPLGEHPTSTRPGVAFAPGTRPRRRQRRDTKQTRHRPVTNPENKPLRRPKRGVRSAAYVIEGGGGRADADAEAGRDYLLVDDPLEEFRESEAVARMRRAASCSGSLRAAPDAIKAFRTPALTRMRKAALFGGGKVVGDAVF